MDPSASLFAPENRAQLAESFKSFVARPENQPLLEQQQRKEVKQALKLRQRLGELQLRAQVLALSQQQQQSLAPVLAVPVLRSLLQSLAGTSNGSGSSGSSKSSSRDGRELCAGSVGGNAGNETGLADWAESPLVMGMLTQAVALLKEGRVSEDQLEALLLSQLQDPNGSFHEEFKAKLPNHVSLPSHLLMEALNEHLKERRAGNQAYQKGLHAQAMCHYERALSIVEFVRGAHADDQAEVDSNKATVLLNLAAVHMACHEWGAAVARCDASLAVQKSNAAALVRRAKANLGRHEYQAALHDLSAASELDPWHEELPTLKLRAAMGRKPAVQERQLCSKMLGLGLYKRTRPFRHA